MRNLSELFGRLSGMSDSVNWGNIGLSWSRDGYIFLVVLRVEERPLHECEEELRQTIEDVLAEDNRLIRLRAKPQSIEHTESSARVDQGELEIVTSRMMGPNEGRLFRESIDSLLDTAVARATEAIERDEALATALREAIRSN